jgi:hypothetical protein
MLCTLLMKCAWESSQHRASLCTTHVGPELIVADCGNGGTVPELRANGRHQYVHTVRYQNYGFMTKAPQQIGRYGAVQWESVGNALPPRTSVYPREVVKRALELHAGAVILAHNHPLC